MHEDCRHKLFVYVPICLYRFAGKCFKSKIWKDLATIGNYPIVRFADAGKIIVLNIDRMCRR